MSNQIQHQQFRCCYQNWLAQQRLDLNELHQALTHHPTDLDYLQLVTKKTVTHFENYNNTRAQLAKHDGASFLAPNWGTNFENSLLWIGGCRPTMIIRLVYVLCGVKIDAQLTEFLERIRHGNLGDISSLQLKVIDDIHAKTVKDEDKLSSRVSTLQERVAAELLVSSNVEVVEKAKDAHALDLYNILIEADKLRLSVLKGILGTLTPLQAVEFLVVSKKLHLSLHDWSTRRDVVMGITQLLGTNNPSSSSDPPKEP